MKLNDVLVAGKRVAVYARVSNDDQEHEMQLGYIKEYLNKYGCEIVQTYIDHGRSATKLKLENRKAIFQMLADAKCDKFDFIAAYKRDRIARQNEDHFLIRTILSKAEMPIVLCNENCLYQSDDKILDMIQNAMTSYETQQNSDRTSDHHADNTKKGKYMGSNLPYGYIYEDGKVKVDEDDAKIVIEIYRLYKNGLGYQKIANSLQPASKKRRKGKNTEVVMKNWTANEVESVITSYQYTGRLVSKNRAKDRRTLTPRDQWIISKENAIPIIIADKEWEICYRLYLEKRGNHSPRHFTTSFFLKDIIKCRHHNPNPLPLSTRDLRTRDKKTGEKQGNRIYKCEVCNYAIPAEDIHRKIDYLILNKIATEFFCGDISDLHDQIKLSNFNEVEKLKIDILALEDLINQYLISLDRSKDELKKRIPRKELEKKDFLILLQRHQLHTNQRIEGLKKLIEQKKERIDLIDLVLSDYERWVDLVYERISYKEDDDDNLLRRLVLYLLDEVLVEVDLISGDYHAALIAKGDLEAKFQIPFMDE